MSPAQSPDERRIIAWLTKLAAEYEALAERASVFSLGHNRVRAALLRRIIAAIAQGKHR